MTTAHNFEALSRYFEQAASLRLCLQYNQEDYAYARGGGRIIYLMDANVVRFFIDPEDEADHVAVFGKSSFGNYSTGTALITAEFLFSRGLAGQGDSPALVSPAHADEVLGIVDDIRDAIATASRDNEASHPLAPEIVEKLKQLVARISTRHGDAPETELAKATAELTNLVPEVAGQVLKGAFLWLNQLRRLYDEDLLRPLALHTATTADVLSPPTKLVEFWTERIHQERNSQASQGAPRHGGGEREKMRERGRRSSSDSDRTRRDAETLAQISVLDAAVQGEQVAYVLVTADHRLFDAYAKWYWNEAEPSKRGRFLLRSILQYAPILNVSEMPNGIAESDVFARASNALDTLFANLIRVDTAYPHKLSFYRILARQNAPSFREALTNYFTSDPLQFGKREMTAFQDIRRHWHDSFRTGVLLNAELMQRRLKAVFGPLAQLLRDDVDLRFALHDNQRKMLERIEREHLYFSTRLNLSLMSLDGERAGSKASRAPLLIRARTQSEPLLITLDRIAETNLADVFELYRSLEAQDQFESFLFAACVAFRCEHWSAAVHYSGRALDVLSRRKTVELETEEVSFLMALAIRYSIASANSNSPISRDRLERARSILTSQRVYFAKRSDLYAEIRSEIESDALELVVHYRNRLISQPQLETLQSRPSVKASLSTAARAADILAPPLHSQDEAFEAAARVLRSQSWSNVISAAVFVLTLDVDREGEKEAYACRAEIEETIERLGHELSAGQLPPIVVAEHLIARWKYGRIRQEEAAAELEQLIPSEVDGRLSLELDRAELAAFRDLLARRSSSPRLGGGFGLL